MNEAIWTTDMVTKPILNGNILSFRILEINTVAKIGINGPVYTEAPTTLNKIDFIVLGVIYFFSGLFNHIVCSNYWAATTAALFFAFSAGFSLPLNCQYFAQRPG